MKAVCKACRLLLWAMPSLTVIKQSAFIAARARQELMRLPWTRTALGRSPSWCPSGRVLAQGVGQAGSLSQVRGVEMAVPVQWVGQDCPRVLG